MSPFPTRRRLMLGLSVVQFLSAGPACGRAAMVLGALERAHGGRLGVHALDTGTGRTLSHRADERFLMQSTFKGMLAAMVLSRVDAGTDALGREVGYGMADLLPSSPETTRHVAAGRMNVGDLCRAILERSDNAAANLLLARVGGPGALTSWVRGLGDAVTRVDRYEPVEGWTGIQDTTTPRAIAGSVREVILGNALSAASRALLRRWMEGNVVGRTRLRASFPPNWSAADRTGTGAGACNDYAVAWPHSRPPLVIAAYYDAPALELAGQEAVLREVGAAIVAWAG